MASNPDRTTLYQALDRLASVGRSGRLHVRHWEDKEGVIGVNEGEIVHCQFGKLRGMEALKILRNWISITLRFFENVENLSVDIVEDTDEILASLEDQDKDIQRIRSVISSPQTIFALSSDSQRNRVSLDRRLWRVLSKINGNNTVRDICHSLRANEFSVCKVLTYLHNQGIIQLVSVGRQVIWRHRDTFFAALEEVLTGYIGPIATVVVDDVLAEMNKSRDYINRYDVPLLVERISENLEDEEERIQFQSHMLTLIQKLSKE
jgi:hypothetical protein